MLRATKSKTGDAALAEFQRAILKSDPSTVDLKVMTSWHEDEKWNVCLVHEDQGLVLEPQDARAMAEIVDTVVGLPEFCLAAPRLAELSHQLRMMANEVDAKNAAGVTPLDVEKWQGKA